MATVKRVAASATSKSSAKNKADSSKTIAAKNKEPEISPSKKPEARSPGKSASIGDVLNRIMSSPVYKKIWGKPGFRPLQRAIADMNGGEAPHGVTLGRVVDGDTVKAPYPRQVELIASMIPDPKMAEQKRCRSYAIAQLTAAFNSVFPDRSKKVSIDPEKVWAAIVGVFDSLFPEPEEVRSIDPRDLWAVFAGQESFDSTWLKSKEFDEYLKVLFESRGADDNRRKEEEARLREQEEERRRIQQEKELKQKKIEEEQRRIKEENDRFFAKLSALIREDMEDKGFSEEEYAIGVAVLHPTIFATILNGEADRNDPKFKRKLAVLAGKLVNPDTEELFLSSRSLYDYCEAP